MRRSRSIRAPKPRRAAAVSAVIEPFEQQNPAYSLYVNTHVRSLGEQIDKWNRNASVEAGAEELVADFDARCTAHEDGSPAQARAFLTGWTPSSTVSLAAPGMSPHGRGRAYDFQIMPDGGDHRRSGHPHHQHGVGGRRPGRQAEAGGNRRRGALFGPLEKPYEPWHYDYDPALEQAGLRSTRWPQPSAFTSRPWSAIR